MSDLNMIPGEVQRIAYDTLCKASEAAGGGPVTVEEFRRRLPRTKDLETGKRVGVQSKTARSRLEALVLKRLAKKTQTQDPDGARRSRFEPLPIPEPRPTIPLEYELEKGSRVDPLPALRDFGDIVNARFDHLQKQIDELAAAAFKPGELGSFPFYQKFRDDLAILYHDLSRELGDNHTAVRRIGALLTRYPEEVKTNRWINE